MAPSRAPNPLQRRLSQFGSRALQPAQCKLNGAKPGTRHILGARSCGQLFEDRFGSFHVPCLRFDVPKLPERLVAARQFICADPPLAVLYRRARQLSTCEQQRVWLKPNGEVQVDQRIAHVTVRGHYAPGGPRGASTGPDERDRAFPGSKWASRDRALPKTADQSPVCHNEPRRWGHCSAILW